MNSPSLYRGSSSLPSHLCRPCLRRYLHTSRLLASSKRSKIKAFKAAKIPALKRTPAPSASSVISPFRQPKDRTQMVPEDSFTPYTEADLADLRKRYTPEQMAAIEASEAAVDPADLASQAVFRTNDAWVPPYAEDFSRHDPLLDKPVQPSDAESYDPTSRFKTPEEIQKDFANFMWNLPPSATGREAPEFLSRYRVTTGKEGQEHNPIRSVAPEIPRGIPGLTETSKQKADEGVDPAMERLRRATGLDVQTIRTLRQKTLIQKFVTNQTSLGKINHIYIMIIVGNRAGMLGVGEGKSSESNEARAAAFGNAVRNMRPIPRYEHRTIFGDVSAKVGGTGVELFTRPPGFGVRCSELIYEMCRCAGIEDMSARVSRSRNPMNVIKATLQALLSQRLPEDVAQGLGRKLVDLRKVYYAGLNA